MKKVLIGMLLLLAIETQAQTWNEWFRQKRTQIKYLVQQIAGLQVYIELGQQGYGIARDGLNLISDIKHGDFDLHHSYFNSLVAINPAVRKYEKVVAIYFLEAGIEQQTKVVVGFINGNAMLDEDERAYIERVVDNFLQSLHDEITQLDVLLSVGNYALKDNERLTRIDEIHQTLQAQYAFIKSLDQQVRKLIFGKQKDLHDAQRLNRLFNTEMP